MAARAGMDKMFGNVELCQVVLTQHKDGLDKLHATMGEHSAMIDDLGMGFDQFRKFQKEETEDITKDLEGCKALLRELRSDIQDLQQTVQGQKDEIGNLAEVVHVWQKDWLERMQSRSECKDCQILLKAVDDLSKTVQEMKDKEQLSKTVPNTSPRLVPSTLPEKNMKEDDEDKEAAADLETEGEEEDADLQKIDGDGGGGQGGGQSSLLRDDPRCDDDVCDPGLQRLAVGVAEWCKKFCEGDKEHDLRQCVAFCNDILHKADALSFATMGKSIWEQDGVGKKEDFIRIEGALQEPQRLDDEAKKINLMLLVSMVNSASNIVMAHMTDVANGLEDTKDAASGGDEDARSDSTTTLLMACALVNPTEMTDVTL